MVRGCQKKIVYLKNTGSEVFDEAFFVVKENTSEIIEECDMVKEATKILNESFFTEEKDNIILRIRRSIKSKILPFFMGVVIGVVTTVLIK